MTQPLRFAVAPPFEAPAELTLAGGSSAELIITFRPTEVGPFSTELIIGAQTIPLRGNGLEVPECQEPANACNATHFDPTEGQCVVAARPDGSECTTRCVISGLCSQGTCAGDFERCDDANACTDDSCSEAQGCLHAAKSCPASPTNPCRVGACVPARGCGFVDAADGVRCGPRDCRNKTVPVCIAAQCLPRPLPAPECLAQLAYLKAFNADPSDSYGNHVAISADGNTLAVGASLEGKFQFANLPGAAFGQQVTVLVAPYDENEDGVPDYNASSRSYSLFPGFATYKTITLIALGVQLVTSNVSDADLLPNEALTLTFSGQVRVNQSTVTLFRNAGSVQVGAMLEWDTAGTTATLTPVGGNLVEGQAYYVLYNVKAFNGAATTNSINFVVRPPLGAPPLGTVDGFRATVPLVYDSGLGAVTLAWNALANAGGYRVYGKDTATASAYLLLTSLSSGLSTSATVNLNLFDSIGGDAFTTPLGHHNRVKLAIVAIDRVGNETPFATAASLELSDGVAPTVLFAQQTAGTANNASGGSPATVLYQVNFSELMDNAAMPQIVLPNGATSAIWAWTTANRGTFTITIPAGIDGRGTVSITAGLDTSGNAQAAAFDASLQ